VTATLIVQPEAEADLQEAYRWYETQRQGLGRDLLTEASRVFLRVAEQPFRHAPIHGETRRVLLRRFPYVVFYIAREDGVFVLAVLHQRRNPNIARARSRSFDRD
jgi:plasmid stabilization system protein ParE